MAFREQSSRRSFLKATGGAASLAFAAPSIVPNSVIGANPPSDKVVVGIIGLGWRGMDLLNGCRRNDQTQVAAICDVDLHYILHARQILDDHYGVVDRTEIEGSGGNMRPAPLPEKAVACYTDYRYMIERNDMDGVLVAVPDHWHAKIFNDAMRAGLDVYGEKPLSLTVQQGRAIADVAKQEGRVFQTGTQQRSGGEFWDACSYVRAGRIGKISHVDVGVGGAPQTEAVPDEPVPPGVDWDMWLGPAPYHPYNPLRRFTTYRWFFDYSGGMVTDWGAHHLDIAQWGLDKDETGPRYVEGDADTRPGFYDTFTSFNTKFTFDDGVVINFSNEIRHGITFHGEKGEIWCARGDKSSTIEGLFDEPLGDDDPQLYRSTNHLQNWLDCIKTREECVSSAETGHRSATLCHLANIVGWEKRKLEWDPVKETFIDDDNANRHLDREPRKPWSYL